MLREPPSPNPASRHEPNRRALIGGGLAAGALTWVAPAIVSGSAASAATVAPGIVIDDFTIPDAVVGDNESTFAIAPVGGIFVARRIFAVRAGAVLAIQSGHATFTGGPVGMVDEIDWTFASPLDLSGRTSVTAASTITGVATFQLLVDPQGGLTTTLAPTTTQPELRFDLTSIAPVTLGITINLTLLVRSVAPATVQLGPLSAS